MLNYENANDSNYYKLKVDQADADVKCVECHIHQTINRQTCSDKDFVQSTLSTVIIDNNRLNDFQTSVTSSTFLYSV